MSIFHFFYNRDNIDNLTSNIDFRNYYNKAEINTTVAKQTYTISETLVLQIT